MNNLNELNTILFETLRGAKDGTIDDKKVHAITSVSSTIINAAKLQFNAAKQLKGGSLDTEFFGKISANNQLGGRMDNNTYNKKLEFAISMGYESISEAMDKLGKSEFNQKFKELSR